MLPNPAACKPPDTPSLSTVLLQRHSNMLAVFVFSVLFLGKYATAFTTADCPYPVTHDRWNQVLGDRCYRFELETSLEYFDAERFCERKGGLLVKIPSRSVNTFLYSHLRNTYGYSSEVWIGLNDDDTENHFVWTDGTSLGSYNNWGHNEGPRTGGIEHVAEDCVVIDSSGVWRDYRCSDVWYFLSEHKRFICEFKIPHPPATTSKPNDTTVATTFEATASATTPSASATTPSASATTPSASATTPSASATTAGIKATGTMPPVVSTTTTTLKPETTTVYTCPNLTCELNCGMDGYATNAKGCTICKCVV